MTVCTNKDFINDYHYIRAKLSHITFDKSQICMRFTFIYLVFCIVYHLFWAFLCVFWSCRWCSSRRIEERAKWSKKESKEAILGKVREHAAAWFCHAAAGLSVKNPRLTCRSMPNSCRSMPRRCKKRILKTCRSMPKSCRGMATFINLGYFWQLGFGLLCNTTFFAHIKKK